MLFLLPRLLLFSCIAFTEAPVLAAWEPEDVDLTRPRLLFRSGDLPELRERLQREPYRTLFLQPLDRAAEADGVPLEDQTLTAPSPMRAR